MSKIKQLNPPAAKSRPMTEQERKMRIMQFLQQKREAFSLNILCSILRSDAGSDKDQVVNKAVEIADALMERLYPMEEPGKE